MEGFSRRGRNQIARRRRASPGLPRYHPRGTRDAIPCREFTVPELHLRCHPPLGSPRLSRTRTGQTDGDLANGLGPSRRCGFCDVSQQETRRIPALPCRGLEHPANDLFAALVSGAKDLSKSRNSGSLWTLPHHEIVYRPRPTARISFHKIIPLLPTAFLSKLWGFSNSSLAFLCTQE